MHPFIFALGLAFPLIVGASERDDPAEPRAATHLVVPLRTVMQ
jgi:hypothetical protein